MDHIYTDTAEDEVCHPYCHMDEKEEGEFNVVAVVRLIMAFLSFAGALSIVGSAVYRKTLCNPKVRIVRRQVASFFFNNLGTPNICPVDCGHSAKYTLDHWSTDVAER
jgi:hypothetical protein